MTEINLNYVKNLEVKFEKLKKLLNENYGSPLLNAKIERMGVVIDIQFKEIDKLVAENKELRVKLFPYADDTEISGMSWNGFYLIGDKKSIKELQRIQNDSSQLEVYRKAFDERIKQLETLIPKVDPIPDTPKKSEINDELEVLIRLYAGDSIVYSRDGDYAWFTKGDRAFIGNVIIEIREKGYLENRYTGTPGNEGESDCYDDFISEAGRDYIASYGVVSK